MEFTGKRGTVICTERPQNMAPHEKEKHSTLLIVKFFVQHECVIRGRVVIISSDWKDDKVLRCLKKVA